MGPNWQKLRTWKTSHQEAFEELCCQLAHDEAVPMPASFVRVGPPDSGVECYWQFPDGNEWGWQSKFTDSSGVWTQIEDSFEQAFKKRPKLVRYTVCIPFSLSEGKYKETKKSKKKSGRDKWNSFVKKWTLFAKRRGRKIDFKVWDDHELWNRLSKNENAGRRLFWFGDVILDQKWFSDRAEATIVQAGDRYDAVLNISLPQKDLFSAVVRTAEFWKHLEEKAKSFQRVFSHAIDNCRDDQVTGEISEIALKFKETLAAINLLGKSEREHLDYEKITLRLGELRQTCYKLDKRLSELDAIAREEYKIKHNREAGEYDNPRDGFSWHTRNTLLSELSSLTEFLSCKQSRLSNSPYLLLTGEAGSGKTHLLCESASTLLKEGSPVIFLMGDQFNDEEPWSQIVKLLGLNASTEDFLGALDAAASASKLRSVIIIDALNEGPGVTFWNRHLTRMLSDVGRYKGIGVCVSVRNGYEGEISAPVTQKLIHFVHQGFARVALEATIRFFEYFQIASPSVPVLRPEFSNPLFLKLFCRATQAAGQTNAPTGFHGIKQLFDYYVSAVNTKLSKSDCLDFDPSENRVAQAIQALVRKMIALRTPGVPLQVGRDLLSQIHPTSGHSKSLERHLILEGVLARVPYYDSKTGTRQEVLRFPHQRFTDHSIVNALLSDFKKNQKTQLFAAKSSISELLRNSLLGWGRQGFLDALAIQIPERFGAELPDLNTKNVADDEEIQIAFVSSLAWRKPTSITAETKRWVERYRDGSKDGYGKIMNALLNIATCVDHPLSADYLHQILSAQSMGDRDATWSIFVFEEGKEESAVDRLIRWAWSETAHGLCSSEVARLGALGLAWLLTTSQRFVRDEATKALVSLLEKRIPVLQQVLNKFHAVDDPYVTERLYAVAFGCALRTVNMTDLKNLGQLVYDTIFRDGHPLPHVAFRSYAKGVVDTAINAKCAITFGKGKVTPPYSSRWIGSLPSLSSLCKKFGGDSYDDDKTGGRRIYHSITDGDFRAYEMGCAWDWSVRTIGSTEEPFLLTYKRFKSSLGYDAKESFDVYERALSDDQQEKRDIPSGFSSKRRSPDSASAEKDLLHNLDVAQSQFFRRIQPHLKRRDWHSDETHEQEFLQRWILHRVLTLGWTHKRFNEFDSGSFGHSREAYKAERIGKKYQWIALQEFCARLSDNFEFVIDTYRSNNQERVNGWWMSDFRDIDPSNLLDSTFDHLEEEADSCWWVSAKYDSWLKHGTKLDWLKATNDLPNPVELLSVLNPSDQTEWLLLQSVVRWCHEEKLGSLETREPESQNLLYSLTSYLVKSQDLPKMWNWCADQNWENDNWPTASARVHYCLHEHFQLPAFDKVVENEWIVDAFFSRIVPPCPIMLTNDEYLAEKSTHDCSIANTFNIRLPSQWIVENMHLKMGARNGAFYDAKSNLIAFDPSTSMQGPGSLLIKRSVFDQFLKDQKLSLLWVFYGEKNIYNRKIDHSDGRQVIHGAISYLGNKFKSGCTSAFHSQKGKKTLLFKRTN